MNLTKLFHLTFLTACLMLYVSCKKTDKVLATKEKITDNSIAEKFFEMHRTNDPVEKKIVEFIKRKNEKLNFIDQTIQQIGYPRWDKAFTKSKNIKTVSSSANLTGDSCDTYYIPFVRDTQNFVNATMVIKANSIDTTFSYLLDWQYTQKENTITSISDSAEYFAIFFMFMDKQVFGYNEFQVLDSNLFKANGHKAIKINLTTSDSTGSNLMSLVQFCQDIVISYTDCAAPDSDVCTPTCDNCPQCTMNILSEYCWEEWVETGGGGGQGTGNTGGTGNGSGGSGTPTTPCGGATQTPQPFSKQKNGVTSNNNISEPCNGGGGWTPIPIDPYAGDIDVIGDPHAPEYPDVSANDPKVNLQSLFNCFNTIPNDGATYSIKLCADLPVNGMPSAPINLNHQSPGHTFLTLTKTNGTQSISQSVGFYPIGSGGNPYNPNANGGFKNNGNPPHQYNAAISANNVTAAGFLLVINNLLANENDGYNIFNNNCTSKALNAFNLLVTPDINIEPFVVSQPVPIPPLPPFIFWESPQKLYKYIQNFTPSPGLTKEFHVNIDSPLSTIVCP